jgi:ABC-type Fe3+-hydroxamate transport system substrate-binding protein
MSDIYTLEDSVRMILDFGKLTGTSPKAEELARNIQNSFSDQISFRGSCVYLIWENPLLAAGKNTFIDAMLSLAGFENLIQSSRYPELSEEQLVSLSPDFVLLSSEPFPFKEKHIASFQKLLPKSKLILADGELFSWYGSRLLKSASYFKRL